MRSSQNSWRRRSFGATDVIRIDGLRVSIRTASARARSNTTPVVVLRFEADNAAALARIRGVPARPKMRNLHRARSEETPWA
jgi:phosphomannomutase/phosphoglucomutase